MTARDDLAALLRSVSLANDSHGDDATLTVVAADRLTDVILAAGWMPPAAAQRVRERCGWWRDAGEYDRDIADDILAALDGIATQEPEGPRRSPPRQRSGP